MTLTPLAIGMPGPVEWIVIGGIALRIFGKRLPEVAKSLGKGIVEFKKGLAGIDEDVTKAGPAIPAQPPTNPIAPAATAYKFDPYTGKPIDPNTPPAV